MDEYFSHEEIISLKELGLYNDVKNIINKLKKEDKIKKELKKKNFVIKKSIPEYGRKMQQMEKFIDILQQIEPNKIYGIYKTESSDILFIYEEMIPKKEIENLLYK